VPVKRRIRSWTDAQRHTLPLCVTKTSGLRGPEALPETKKAATMAAFFS
jgi:hypothetical protein